MNNMTSSMANIPQEKGFVYEDPENYTDVSETESDRDSEDEDRRKKEPTVSVKHLLDKVLIAIKEGNLDLTEKNQLNNFRKNQGPCLAIRTKDNDQPTALHILVAKDTTEIPNNYQLEPLIYLLVQRQENLLAVTNGAHYTPLYFAISKKKYEIAKFMCLAHETIDSILSISNHEGKNCLHLAIAQRTKLTGFLVDKAGAVTLCAKDKDGNTPLHLAVEYKRCRKEQLPIIKAIVAKCDGTMKSSKDGVFNKASLSPYCHHIESSKKAERRKKEKDAENKRIEEGKGLEKGSDRSRPDNDRRITKDRVEKVKPEPPKVPAMSTTLHQDKNLEGTLARRGNWQVDHLPGRDALLGNNSASDNHGAEQLKATTNTSPTVGTAPDFPGSSIGDKETTTLNKDLSKIKPVSKVTEDTIQPIKHFLKLHYLRERGHDAALEILYGRNTTSDQQIYFDLFGYNNLTEGQIKTTLSFLNFEEILQYVEIPQLRIDVSSNAANIQRVRGRIPKLDGIGRSDFLCVFNGLREKGVNTILKVIVEDLAHPSHSDEAIEKALENMGVEIWDWKKIDLCTEVILKAAPNAREVHLYWSGNNALLRGWSEEGGLKRLKELTTVHLHVQQGLESLARTRQNVSEFCSRMEKLYNRVIVVVDEGLEMLRGTTDIDTARSDTDHPENSAKHEWVECMKEFKQLLFNAENYQENENDKKIGKIEEPIKVALIDDGINFDKLEYTPIGGRSFCTRDEVQNLNFPYYKSSSGHGSIMASQIYRICPRTQLYVLKLEDHMSKSSTRQITAKSAAQAIRAAVRRKVHIISMSWTIDPPEDENDKRDLESAILEAAKEDILMFCSAKDKGAKQTSSYPSLATNKIFKIGAAEASGAPDAWVGDLTRIDFTFPGNQVELEGFSNEINKEVVSGSSVATALAAGLAALILYCVQVRVQYTKGREQENARRDFQALKKHDQMMKAFKSIGTTEESKNKYIAVWELFGRLVRDSERFDKPEWIDLIVKAGTELCAKL